MDFPLAALFPAEIFQTVLALPFAEVWLAAAIAGITASTFASGIPGTLLPISFSSGALLGGWLAIPVVAVGAVAGSLVLYLLFERGSQAALLERYADKLARVEHLTSKAGVIPIICSRVIGIPHVIITALCALGSVGRSRYALSTLVGVLPAIALSATAGAAIQTGDDRRPPT